jgi:hypothetical protein
MSSSAYSQAGPPPPPQGSGCGCGGCLGKFFILLGVVFFLMIALCCGGVFYTQSYFKKAITQQPAQVEAISDEITSMKVPSPPFSPAFGGRFNMPFAGTYLGEGAAYTAPGQKAVLIVASFSDAFGPQFKDQLMKGLEAGPGENKSGSNDQAHEELKDVKKSKVERTIRGQSAQFEISEGVGVKTGVKKIQVQGAFQGKSGATILFIMAEEATLSREEVDKIIQSIEDGAKDEKK